MAISKIKATLYQDHKRDTATCYLKFNNLNEEIFLGFDLNDTDTSFKNKTAKTKSDKTLVSGIVAYLSKLGNDFVIEINISSSDEFFEFILQQSNAYPITHTGVWEKKIEFNSWLQSQSNQDVEIDFGDLMAKLKK